jgi:hypothetical protein
MGRVGQGSMTGAIVAFFDGLRQRGPQLLPERVRGRIRFDLVAGDRVEHWAVAMDRGAVVVSRDDHPADCVVRLREALFERLTAGDESIIAAMVRTECTVEGDVPLLMTFRRFFPPARTAIDPRRWARERRSS